MDTFSGLTDKLVTINLKIRFQQLLLKEISKSEEVCLNVIAQNSWLAFQNIADLYLQRDQLINEITGTFNDLLLQSKAGWQLDNGKNIQRKHKTY